MEAKGFSMDAKGGFDGCKRGFEKKKVREKNGSREKKGFRGKKFLEKKVSRISFGHCSSMIAAVRR